MIRTVALTVTGVLAAIAAFNVVTDDQSTSTMVGIGSTWALEELNGEEGVEATIEFPEAGQIAGQAPCNRYTAKDHSMYPWMDIRAIAATRVACPEMEAEDAFLAAIDDAHIVELEGDTLTVRDRKGRHELVFSRVEG